MATKKNQNEPLFHVEELAENSGLAAWELAGLKRFAGWAEGLQITENDFADALGRFNARTMGGGRQ